MNSRKDFLTYTLEASKLSIDFRVSKVNGETTHRENTPIGLIITCPTLHSFKATDSYTLLDSLQLDSLSVELKGSSYTSFRKTNAKHLMLIAGEHSYAEFVDLNTTDELQTKLSGKTTLRLNGIHFSSFKPSVEEQAEIIFSASAIAQLPLHP